MNIPKRLLEYLKADLEVLDDAVIGQLTYGTVCDIANETGTTPKMVYRAIDHLLKEGY